MAEREQPFWKTKMLDKMSKAEWESLCDACGRCCVEKFENRKTGKVYFTNVACRYLDMQSCRCNAYQRRRKAAPWCLILTPELIPKIRWLPRTCAYRRIYLKKDLKWWHQLLSGSPETVHQAGISVRGKVISSLYVHPEDLENYIVDWKFWGQMGSGLPHSWPAKGKNAGKV